MKNTLLIFVGLLPVLSTGQCLVNTNQSSFSVDCGDSINIVASGQKFDTFILEDFNDALIPGGWSCSGSPMFTNPCSPSLDGTITLWMGSTSGGPRMLNTNGYDVSCGGQVCFDIDFAGDENTIDCEDPDAVNEGVYFRYSINGGATWVDIFYFQPNSANTGPYYSWNNHCFTIPPGAQTTSTMFSWGQSVASSINWDHWGIDNVEIMGNSCSGSGSYYLLFDGASFDGDTTFFSAVDNSYLIEFTNGIDDTCQANISLIVNPFDPGFNYGIDSICTQEAGLLTPVISGTQNGVFSAVPSSLIIDSLTGVIDFQNSLPGQYTITYQAVNSICVGDSSVTLEIIESPVITGTITPDNGSGSGAIDISISSASTTSVNWSNGETAEDITGLSAGNFLVTVVDLNGCSTTETFNVPLVVGFSNLSSEFYIYPNPAKNGFNIESLGFFTYSVKDVTGKELLQGEGVDQVYIPTQNLAKGMFLVEIIRNGETFSTKVILE